MTDYNVIDAYELALQIIRDWGCQLEGEECAEIAHHGETGNLSWLHNWEAPA